MTATREHSPDVFRGASVSRDPRKVATTIVARGLMVSLLAVGSLLSVSVALANIGPIFTTDSNGDAVNQNQFTFSTEVYLSGGPQNPTSAGLTDGMYYFQVTDPSGMTLLSADFAICRQLQVVNGRVAGATGPCPHANGITNPTTGTTPVQISPFLATPNNGQEYKVWLIAQTPSTSISSTNPRLILFNPSDSSTDNFMVEHVVTILPGACQATSSLSVLVRGPDVQSYVPKGNWNVTQVTGVSLVNLEGHSATPTRISTPHVVNSVISNPLTGQSVAVANTADVYLIHDTTITSTLASSGSGTIQFSGGSCTNCGVALDPVRNRALIGLSVGFAPGFQLLNLGSTPSFDPAFISPAGAISEDPLIDPIRNLLLSASENNNYEIIRLLPNGSPAFFENPVAGTGGNLDSSGEDCSTGIVLAPAEFSTPSHVFVGDISQATFTPGTPGSWTAPSRVQVLSESNLSAGSSGIAVAQGTHTGFVSGEFGGNTLTAIKLPERSGTGTPAITDWVTCGIGGGFSNGFDPHTVTAYQSPRTRDPIGVLANAGASALAVVNLSSFLDPTVVPRTAAGHGCASGTLPPSVVHMVPVP
jgi:hypothetical protein